MQMPYGPEWPMQIQRFSDAQRYQHTVAFKDDPSLSASLSLLLSLSSLPPSLSTSLLLSLSSLSLQPVPPSLSLNISPTLPLFSLSLDSAVAPALSCLPFPASPPLLFFPQGALLSPSFASSDAHPSAL